MKIVKVVAAVICDSLDEKKQIFATARGYGETPDQALVREIKEELDTELEIGDLIDTVEYDYPTFHLSMDCFWARVISGDLILKEAKEAKWLSRDELDSVQWLPADIILVKKIKDHMG